MRSERSVSRFGLACVTLGFLALIGSGATAGWFVMRAQDHATWVEHTYEVERRVSTVRVMIERLEAARRGYLLSHRDQIRQTFVQTVRAEPPLLSELRRLTADNPVQQRNIARLETLAAAQFRLLSTSMMLADRNPALSNAIFAHDQSLGLSRQLREVTTAMLDEESRLLEPRIAAQRQAVRTLFFVLAFAGALAVVTAIFSILVLRRYTGDLVESRAAVEALNGELENRVEERTRDLSRANEEIQRFAYIVSHDLRSPLVNVMGFTAELESATRPLAELVDRAEAEAPGIVTEDAKLAAREDLPEAIGFIRTSTQRMDRLINAILKLSREGRRVIAPEPLDLAEIAEASVAAIRHLIDARGAEVEVQHPLPYLVSDRTAIEQVLGNLIENATKYLQPGRPGRIAVTGAREGGRVILRVSDNGRGIAPADHERIFDLFRRSGAQDQPGEGIGLAHVRALAYRLGGVIDVESRLGEGSTFRLSLPATFEEPRA